MFRLTPERTDVSEADVIRNCVAILRKRGYWVQRNPVGMFKTLAGKPVEFGPVGIPDYTAIHRSYPAFFIEFKRPGKKLREDQRTRFSQVQLFYRLAAVMVDSAEELVAFLDGHERRAKTESAPVSVTEALLSEHCDL
jgi:hypothetical protein